MNGQLDTSQVQLIPLWSYLLMASGFAWFVEIVVGVISLMGSVLVCSIVAGMGIMLATLILGIVLSSMASSWEGAKYLFVSNLELTTYLSGEMLPINGMTLSFSMIILALWG